MTIGLRQGKCRCGQGVDTILEVTLISFVQSEMETLDSPSRSAWPPLPLARDVSGNGAGGQRVAEIIRFPKISYIVDSKRRKSENKPTAVGGRCCGGGAQSS